MIRKTFVGLLLLTFVFMVACGPQETSLKDMQVTEDVVDVSAETDTESALKCLVGKQLHYVKKKFIYRMNDKGDGAIMTPVGEYLRSADATGTGWTLYPYESKNDSVYYDTLGYIFNGEFPNGEKIECVEETLIPRDFEKFIGLRYKLFDQINVTILQQQNKAYLH